MNVCIYVCKHTCMHARTYVCMPLHLNVVITNTLKQTKEIYSDTKTAHATLVLLILTLPVTFCVTICGVPIAPDPEVA